MEVCELPDAPKAVCAYRNKAWVLIQENTLQHSQKIALYVLGRENILKFIDT